ncbi:LPO_1073/Vpar_1526 family protein [Streptomyces sp. NPDC057854]|uniref:LPO_1073/Vpar_1526 family protein n=1 Tax=unclassified Streptomyces TaxID=2593676 RepID=UPI0036B5964C
MIWRQRQNGGDGSTNIQSQVVQFGIDYKDAKQIALDVFNENFAKLTQGAYRTANDRAEEFTENYLTELQERGGDSLSNIEDPGIQSDILEAQSGYAKTGDIELGQILVDLLVDRTSKRPRTLTSLALSASISTAQKLTSAHFAALTAIFVLRQVRVGGATSPPVLYNRLSGYLTPLAPEIQKLTGTDVQYLAGLGCITMSIGAITPAEIFRRTYPGLFTKGFKIDQFPQLGDLEGTGVLTRCIRDPENLQIDAVDTETLERKLEEIGRVDRLEELKGVANTAALSDSEILDEFTQGNPSLRNLLDVYQSRELANCTNTAIGTTIAHANLRQVTSGKFEAGLEIWTES